MAKMERKTFDTPEETRTVRLGKYSAEQRDVSEAVVCNGSASFWLAKHCVMIRTRKQTVAFGAR